MAKQHRKLVKEIQCWDFDMLIAHTNTVSVRYLLTAYRVRMESDHRSFGDLFYACCQELDDTGFLEALNRTMIMVVEQKGRWERFVKKQRWTFSILYWPKH